MTKQGIAQVAAAAVLTIAVGVRLGRKTNWRMPDVNSWRTALLPAERVDPEPQDTIYSMMNAARAGDTKAYVAYYTGPMLASLDQTLAATTEADFGKYLKETNAAVMGVTVFDPERVGETEVKVRVEYVYKDRNEAQTVFLEKGPGGWKISRVDAAERVGTPIPYGTLVK
ncbi:MAG TPA: hypothetical protein VGR73_07150 [Bryobacteraceae bacterium]|nr:hypothetical protein [Bryobacteraceae bacterium]